MANLDPAFGVANNHSGQVVVERTGVDADQLRTGVIGNNHQRFTSSIDKSQPALLHQFFLGHWRRRYVTKRYFCFQVTRVDKQRASNR